MGDFLTVKRVVEASFMLQNFFSVKSDRFAVIGHTCFDEGKAK